MINAVSPPAIAVAPRMPEPQQAAPPPVPGGLADGPPPPNPVTRVESISGALLTQFSSIHQALPVTLEGARAAAAYRATVLYDTPTPPGVATSGGYPA